MRLIFNILLIIFISSCSIKQTETPSQKYYGMKSLYKDLLNAAVIYKEDCYQQESYNDCYKYIDKILELNNHVRDAFRRADNFSAQTNNIIKKEVVTIADIALIEMYEYMLKVGAWKNE